jgi:hypothetical protein
MGAADGRPSQPHFSQVCATRLLSLICRGDATVRKDEGAFVTLLIKRLTQRISH